MMKAIMQYVQIIMVAALAWTVVSCGRQAGDSPEPPQAVERTGEEERQEYTVRGLVKEVHPEERRVIIEHENIPGLMPAMTMPFDVKDPKELEGLEPGDWVSFRLLYSADQLWIEQVQKIAEPDRSELRVRPAVRVVRNVEPLEIGDFMPDYRFTNELGRPINLGEFRGNALAFTFIFTRCAVAEFCPQMSSNFSEAYKKLVEMPEAPGNWRLLTISFDPHYDTPEVLQAYGKRYNADPARWNFVTGAMIDLDAITEQFELAVVSREGTLDHTLRTVVVDSEGRIQQIFIGYDWSADDFVKELMQAAEPRGDGPEKAFAN